MNNITGLNNCYTPREVIIEGNFTTRLTAQADSVQCCANLTGNAPYNPSVIAYWTENWLDGLSLRDGSLHHGTTANLIVKWMRGPTGFGRTVPFNVDVLYFPEPPAIQALNCMPTFESSRAEVTVELGTGEVQHHRILDTPVQEDVAWSDAFQWRDIPEDAPYTRWHPCIYGNFSYDSHVTTR